MKRRNRINLVILAGRDNCPVALARRLSTSAPEFFVDGLAPDERKNDSQSGWAAMAEYWLADEGICTLLPPDLDFKYAIAAECSVGMVFQANEEVSDG